MILYPDPGPDVRCIWSSSPLTCGRLLSAGLELGPVPLQDLFVHLTDTRRRGDGLATTTPGTEDAR